MNPSVSTLSVGGSETCGHDMPAVFYRPLEVGVWWWLALLPYATPYLVIYSIAYFLLHVNTLFI